MIYVDEIARSSERIAGLITKDNFTSQVPSCPEWTLFDLVSHIGEVQNFWSHSILEAIADVPWPGEVSKPDSPGNAGKWLRVQTQSLIDAINSTAVTSPCWTWWGDPQTASAVARHQVQEAELHRWDGELALGTPNSLPLHVATDGIPEFLHVHRFSIQKLELPHIHLVASDSDADWHVNDAASETVAISGTASDLLLFLSGRLPVDKLRVTG
ncbi:MAG: maleylpyruvate isomerase family mycothiol-dependent enzyme, partial [Ilumatobacteraceae bacterium]